MKEEINSRGSEEEKLRGIMNMLHIETHLTDSMAANPSRAEEFAGYLDSTRKTRQELVRNWAGKNFDPNQWCAVKHSLETERHIEEMISNAARKNPSEVLDLNERLMEVKKERGELVKSFKSDGSDNIEECWRCEEDLSKLSNAVENLNPPKNLNTKGSFNNHNSNKKINLVKKEDKKMVYAPKEIGLINAGQFVGKGVLILTDKVDEWTGKTAASVFKRPSTYVNILGGGLLQYGGFKSKNKLLGILMIITGSHMVSKVVDYVKEAAVPAGMRRIRARQVLPTPTVRIEPTPPSRVTLF